MSVVGSHAGSGRSDEEPPAGAAPAAVRRLDRAMRIRDRLSGCLFVSLAPLAVELGKVFREDTSIWSRTEARDVVATLVLAALAGLLYLARDQQAEMIRERRLIRDAFETGYPEASLLFLRLVSSASEEVRLDATAGAAQLLPAYIAGHAGGISATFARELRKAIRSCIEYPEREPDAMPLFLVALDVWHAQPALADARSVSALREHQRPEVRDAALKCADALGMPRRD